MLSQSEKIFLFGSYILGFIAAVYIGIQIQKHRTRKHVERMIEVAYRRGWKAGHEFVDRVKTEQLDMESAVRILEGGD